MCNMTGIYIILGTYANNVKSMCSSAPGLIVDWSEFHMHVNTNVYTLACLTTQIHKDIHGDSFMTDTGIQTNRQSYLSAYIHLHMHNSCMSVYM